VTSAARPGEVLLPVRRQSLGEESQVVSVTFSAPAREPGGRFSSLDPRLPEFPGVPVDATTWRVLLPEDRAYSFGGNLDPVEEVEVDIARAEAYAEDVFRLRKVFSEGSEAQQTMAVENIASNAEVLRQTLERAQSRLSDLDEAAKAGQVDAGRVAESRRKAQELAREIDEALKDVQTKAPQRQGFARTGHGGQYRGPSGETTAGETGRDAESMPQTEADYRGRAENLLTREGQSQKQWSTNAYGRAPMQEQAPQEEERAAAGEGKGGRPEADPNLSALGYFGNFDKNLRAGAVLVVQGDGVPADSRMPEDAPPPPETGGGTPTPPDGGGGEVVDEVREGDREDRSGFGGGGGGSGRRAGPGADQGWKYKEGRLAAGTFARGNGPVSGPGATEARRGVAGVVSLAPPLLESGRAYSFRKLDAGAELSIGTRPLGIARRLLGAALFAFLVGLVWVLRRRRAQR
jgi:hypothetical protein